MRFSAYRELAQISVAVEWDENEDTGDALRELGRLAADVEARCPQCYVPDGAHEEGCPLKP